MTKRTKIWLARAGAGAVGILAVLAGTASYLSARLEPVLRGGAETLPRLPRRYFAGTAGVIRRLRYATAP
jgi:hypothetical protein